MNARLTTADDHSTTGALASDGRLVTIRPARPGDQEALTAICEGSRPAAPGITIVALEGDNLIGAAFSVRVDPGGATAEMTVVITEQHRRRGIGALLADRLAAYARDRGITRLLSRSAGSLPLPDHPGHRAPGTDAPSLDDRSPLHRLLAPRSVAVVGAGRRRGGAGHEALRALRDYDFHGRLYAVNRSGRPVCGVPARRTVADLPEPVDLLVVAVPADQVAGVLADAGPLGAGGAVLLGTGLPGGDPVAERCRWEIRRAAREHGIRLVGPTCLGIFNADPQVRLDATLAPARPPGGGLALAVRSGAIGVALMADAVRDHCGISGVVSLGDEIDVTGADLLGYWFDDPVTRAVALSPESFGDPAGLARAARALGRRKPVLAIAGAPPGTCDGRLLAQAGVIPTASLGETLDTARILIDQPLPAGSRMAILGSAGGLTALAADTARAYGFDITALSRATRAELPALAGSEPRDNPVDLGVDALPARIAEAAETVANSGEVDILLVVMVGIRANVLAANLAALAPVLDDHPHLTVAAAVTGDTGDVHQLGRRAAPVYRTPEQAVRALAHARDYAAWRREPLGRCPALEGVHAASGRALIRYAAAAGPSPVNRRLTADILAAYGITMMSAVPAWPAEQVGHPVVVETTGAVREGYETTSRGGGVLLRQQAEATVELTARVTRDLATGPALTLASTDDQVTRLLPLTDLDAGRMWLGLHRPSALSDHDDSRPPVDAASVQDLLLRLARLAEDLPESAELELRPVLAGPDGLVVANATLRLAPHRPTRPGADGVKLGGRHLIDRTQVGPPSSGAPGSRAVGKRRH